MIFLYNLINADKKIIMIYRMKMHISYNYKGFLAYLFLDHRQTKETTNEMNSSMIDFIYITITNTYDCIFCVKLLSIKCMYFKTLFHIASTL